MAVAPRVTALLDIVSNIVLIAAGVGLLWFLLSGPTTPERILNVNEHIEAGTATNVMGSGPIAIVEFSDYECPFCTRHATETLPIIEEELVEPNTVTYAAFHFPLERIHPQALQASEAAECAARQGWFWKMHASLYQNSPALKTSDLVGYATELGLDGMRFATCLEQDTSIEKVRADQAVGTRLGVTATPSFFFGIVQEDGGIDLLKRINGAFSPELLDEVITELNQQLSNVRRR